MKWRRVMQRAQSGSDRICAGTSVMLARAGAALLCLLMASSSFATVYKWQLVSGSAAGDFSDANHWDPSGGPPLGNSDTAIIDLSNMGTKYTVTVSSNIAVGSLTLNNVDAILSDEGHNTIAVGGASDLKVGTVNFGSAALWSGNGISGPITVEGAAIFNADTGISTIREDLTNLGTFKVAHLFMTPAATLVFDTVTTTTNKSSFTLDPGATLNITGSTFDQNAGTLGMDSTSACNVTAGGMFKYSGGSVLGTVNITGGNLNISAGGPGTFIYQFTSNSLDGTVAGQSIVIEGSDAQGLGSVTWDSGFTNASGIITLTSIGASAHNSSLTVATGGNTLVNSGEIDFLPGTGGTRYLYADAKSNTSTGVINVKASTISDQHGGTGNITNAGTVLITSAGTLNVSDFELYTQTAGSTQVDGTLELTPSTTANILHLDGGVLKGTGSVVAQIAASGTARISPGDSIGTLTVTGNVTLSGSSGLTVELGSPGSPGISDLLAITGNLDLSSLSDEMDISGGSGSGFYTVITYTGTRTGTFDVVTPGYNVDYSHAGEVRISIPEPSLLCLLPIAALALRRRT